MWICDEDRFNWYCDIPPEAEPTGSTAENPEAKALREEEEAVAALKALREDAERKRALAIIKPTPENLKRYIVAQEALMERASVFSDVWRRVIWANPELNYQLRNPSNNAAIQVRDTQRARKASETLAGLAGEWGLFFFFRSDCPYCHRLAPTLARSGCRPSPVWWHRRATPRKSPAPWPWATCRWATPRSRMSVTIRIRA
jgi:conjugal transfer pilus assembly protein TraF